MTWHARPLLAVVTVLMAFGGGSDGIAQTPMPAPLPAPVITPPGDVFNAASWDRIVIISCDVPEATIRFTTDGTEPGEESTVYTEPIVVPDEAHVKAKAYKTNSAPSPTAAAVFASHDNGSEPSETVMVLRGGTKGFRALGSSLIFDKVPYETFAKVVWSATMAATWHHASDDDGRVLEIDGRLPGLLILDSRAASTLFTTVDGIERALPEGWRLVEVGVTDPGLYKAIDGMLAGAERKALIKVHPGHLYQVHFRFEHAPSD